MSAIYFGPPWDAPAVEHATQGPTPVGQPCITCTDPIAPGERGWLRPALLATGAAGLHPIHAECELAALVGHIVRVCSCHGFTPGTRATAREAWRRFFGSYPSQATPVDPYGISIGGDTCEHPEASGD